MTYKELSRNLFQSNLNTDYCHIKIVTFFPYFNGKYSFNGTFHKVIVNQGEYCTRTPI